MVCHSGDKIKTVCFMCTFLEKKINNSVKKKTKLNQPACCSTLVRAWETDQYPKAALPSAFRLNSASVSEVRLFISPASSLWGCCQLVVCRLQDTAPVQPSSRSRFLSTGSGNHFLPQTLLALGGNGAYQVTCNILRLLSYKYSLDILSSNYCLRVSYLAENPGNKMIILISILMYVVFPSLPLFMIPCMGHRFHLICVYIFISYIFPLIITYDSPICKNLLYPKSWFLLATFCSTIWLQLKLILGFTSNLIIYLLFISSNIVSPYFLCVYFTVLLLKRGDLTGSVCHPPFGKTHSGHNLKPCFLMDNEPLQCSVFTRVSGCVTSPRLHSSELQGWNLNPWLLSLNLGFTCSNMLCLLNCKTQILPLNMETTVLS